MDTEKQIKVLKNQLRKQYQHYQKIKPDYDCGSTLLKHVSVDFSEACRALNATLDQLAVLDPDTPTTRF